MVFMIIEKFHPNKVKELYQRFAEKGRLLPDGVIYVNSWINENITVCYQLMEAESIKKIEEWTARWEDLADFEIIPVISSAEAKSKIFAR